MKAIDIALKDLTRSFRSAFALAFMFLVPILVTGMFYLMFGGLGGDGEGFSVPQTDVRVVNLDEGSPGFDLSNMEMAGVDAPAGSGDAETMGEMLVQSLQSEGLSDIMAVTEVADVAGAKAAVDDQEAGVAIIIPENLTAALINPAGEATIDLYQDPTLTLGPSIVKSVVGQFVDSFSGTKITLNVVNEQLAGDGLAAGPAQMQSVLQAYVASATGQGGEQQAEESLVDVRAPAGQESNSANQVLAVVAPIMGGMMIFYAFFTGASSAQSILTEEEEGTLPRLFTTPTPMRTIFAGKFLAGLLTILVQVTVLLLFANLVFGIDWGDPLPVALAALGIIFSAATFGLFVMSLVKSSKQAGVIYGGLITLTGMLGMLPIFTGTAPNTPSFVGTVSLVVPQGWALRILQQAMDGLAMRNIALTLAVLFAWSAAFFVIGVLRLQRRYA